MSPLSLQRAFLSVVAVLAMQAPASALAADEARTSEKASDVVASAKANQRGQAKSKDAKEDAGAKTLSGMSILGNQEAPKALVIVPWKSSALGDTLGMSKNLDDSRRPVDKEVFVRELTYYDIRSNSK